VNGRLSEDDFFKYAVLTGYPPDPIVKNIIPVKIKRRRSRDSLNIRKNEPYIFFGEMKFLYYGIGKKDYKSNISKIITEQC